MQVALAFPSSVYALGTLLTIYTRNIYLSSDVQNVINNTGSYTYTDRFSSARVTITNPSASVYKVSVPTGSIVRYSVSFTL